MASTPDDRTHLTPAQQPERGLAAPREPQSPACSKLQRPHRLISEAQGDPRVQSLMRLLDDPSSKVWEPVFRELRQRGPSVLGPLRKAAKDDNPVLRARARSLLLGHERRRRLRRVLGYVARPRPRLETALWLLAGLEGPNFDRRPFLRELDALAELCRESHKGVLGEMDRAMVLPNFLGERFRFELPASADPVLPAPVEGEDELFDENGDDDWSDENLDLYTHHPHRIFLHQVLRTRKGLPLSLALIWRLVADRLSLPLEIVGIPGHVLVRVPAGTRRILVDPCAGGRPVSRREVREYLEAHGIRYRPEIFDPMDDRSLLRRQVANWMRGLGLRGQYGQAEELLSLHALLDS